MLLRDEEVGWGRADCFKGAGLKHTTGGTNSLNPNMGILPTCHNDSSQSLSRLLACNLTFRLWRHSPEHTEGHRRNPFAQYLSKEPPHSLQLTELPPRQSQVSA